MKKDNDSGWLTEAELAHAAGVPVSVVQQGLKSGLFDAWVRFIGGTPHFAPDTVTFVRWSSRLVDKVAAGEIAPIAASERLWRRARRSAAR